MFDVKIYGEVVPFEDIWGGLVNLSKVQEQLTAAEGKDVRVRINCVGGDVAEGFAIYSELRRYAKENGAKITTLAEGQCASIATVIFLAGDERITTEVTSPFVHNAWTYIEGDAKQLMRVAVDLEACNKQIAEHYAAHTDLSYEEARELMANESYISPSDCVAVRFATSIEEVLRPVALQKRVNLKTNKMNTKKKSKGMLATFKALFANKILFDADTREVDFFELTDSDTITEGDFATIDGEDAQGEVVMATGETYVFEAGELITITPAADPGDPGDGETMTTEEAVARIEELEGLLARASVKYNRVKEDKKALLVTLSEKETALSNLAKAKGKYAETTKKETKEGKEEPKPANKFDKAITALEKRKKQ